MKTLNETQLETIEAGGFWDGVCTGVALAARVSGLLALTPAGATVLVAGGVACTLWKAFS